VETERRRIKENLLNEEAAAIAGLMTAVRRV